ETRDLHERISRVDQEGWRAVRALCGMEGPVFCSVHPAGRCRMRCLVWSIWAGGQAGSDDHPDRAEARLLLPVALCLALSSSAINGDARTADWSRHRDPGIAPTAVPFR